MQESTALKELALRGRGVGVGAAKESEEEGMNEKRQTGRDAQAQVA